ncbi:uncharacterized protein LOC110856539 isoform X2 [Folsomia candida]|nr:uncharacterized protein LOC110856539 isoform X2 [Folsomia candida]
MLVSDSTWTHLRIPFFFLLSPVYFFSWSQVVTGEWSWFEAALIFVLPHFLLYPAANGYNSYFDKDEGSIGILEKPPTVTDELYWTTWALEGIAVLVGAVLLNSSFLATALLGVVFSKAYSHPAVRIKAYPILSWILVPVVQGYCSILGITGALLSSSTGYQDMRIHLAGILTTLQLLAFYPMGQVYQHDEDRKRGDMTISLVLGVRGTFKLAWCCAAVANAGFLLYFVTYYKNYGTVCLALLGSLVPPTVYAWGWSRRVWADEKAADFKGTMKLFWLGAMCNNLFYMWLTYFTYMYE